MTSKIEITYPVDEALVLDECYPVTPAAWDEIDWLDRPVIDDDDAWIALEPIELERDESNGFLFEAEPPKPIKKSFLAKLRRFFGV